MTMPTTTASALLANQQFIALTTYRKNGNPVMTPVWFAMIGENIYVTTNPESGKAKRIRATRRVSLAPSDFRGGVLGDSLQGAARLLPKDDPLAKQGLAALQAKYGLSFRMFSLMWRFQRSQMVILEITPGDDQR